MSKSSCYLRWLLLVLSVVLLAPVAAYTQQTTGGITGIVTDAQQGTLAGSSVDALE